MPNDSNSQFASTDALATIADCAQQLNSALREYTASSQQSMEKCALADKALLDSLVNITTAIGALDEIRRNGEKIAEIVEVVRDISFQSRMLSLNAAVEAAHAGEAGKGFAIVAEEVRNLAHRSADASRDIKTLTSDILEKIDEGSEAVDETAGDIAEIRGHVDDTKSTMVELVEGVAGQRGQIDRLLQVVADLESDGH